VAETRSAREFWVLSSPGDRGVLYSFEDFSLDTARRELRRSGALIALQPQVFDLLEYAIRNRERVVSKDDLLAAVWHGRIVSESTLSTRINAARSALGDSGEEQRLLRTAHGKGIRFVGSVREEAETARKLAVIFAANLAAYSRLMEQDEVGALRRLTASRAILDGHIAVHRGRIVGSAADSVVADFASAADAVQCAVAVQVQDAIAKGAAARPAREELHYRIGVHIGDVIVQGENLSGDGVDIATRLEALAEPGGICISGTVRDQIGAKLPIAFADLGEQQVKNIAQPVRTYRVHSTGAAAVAVPALPMPDKPSIAVLPFQNLSGDSEQEYFADGMVEEIITALSRIRWLFVIARNSSFTYKGKAIDVKQVGRELGVHYVLEGSVRNAGGHLRATAQLIDAATGAHLWAERFDGLLEAVFELQDQVATDVAAAIEFALQSVQPYRPADLPIPAERRQLTVMSCNLAEAAALASRLDPEDLRDLIAAYHRAIAEIVIRYEGFVARHLGDGVLIYFGYPRAHDDDAERAIRCALTVADTVTRLKPGEELGTRVGIATSMVVVGGQIDGGGSRDISVVGEAPSLAARLQDVAAPSSVLIAESTRGLVGELFEYHPVEPKGIGGPLRAWQVLRPSVVDSRFEALHGSALTRLIGRDEEIDLLLRRWERAKTGTARLPWSPANPASGSRASS
jgi:class 3 adenylate cyclase